MKRCGNVLFTADGKRAWEQTGDKWKALPAPPDCNGAESEDLLYKSLRYEDNPLHTLLQTYYVDEDAYEYLQEKFDYPRAGLGVPVFAYVFRKEDGGYLMVIEAWSKGTDRETDAPFITNIEPCIIFPDRWLVEQKMFDVFFSTVADANQSEADDIEPEVFYDSVRLAESRS